MPEHDYLDDTGPVYFCKRCSLKFNYHIVGYEEQDLDELVGEPCKICDYPISDIHHIIPKQYGGAHVIENLVNLCPNHHRAFHTILSLHKKIKIMKNKNPNNWKLNQQAKIVSWIMSCDKPMYDYFRSIEPLLESSGVYMSDAETFRMIEKSEKNS